LRAAIAYATGFPIHRNIVALTGGALAEHRQDANHGCGRTRATAGRGRIYDSVTETTGDTPIVSLSRLPQMKRPLSALVDTLARLSFAFPSGPRNQDIAMPA
jgi:hypothetical protein